MPTRIHVTTESLQPSAERWNSTYTTFRAVSSLFTSSSSIQTLEFNQLTNELSILGGNIVSLSSLADTGLGMDTAVRSLTSQWNSTYTTVNANSAVVWNYQGTDLKDLSANWQETYTTFKNASSTFLTCETDSQTLAFDELSKDLSISNGNVVSLSSLFDATAIDTNVRALTSNWESTYTTVLANSSSWVNGVSAEKVLARVHNEDTATMVKGSVVYTFGATGDVMSVKLASNASEATSSKTLGFVNETIATGGIGYVVIAGQIDKMSIPHQTYSEGDALWLGSTPGSFTNIKPVAPEHGVYLGVVERANNGMGLAYVKVQNGYELNEIHDVLITSVSAGDVIRRNGSNNLWTNTNDGAKWDSVYTTVSSVSSTWLTSSYLSTNNVTISSLTVTTTISAKDQIYFDNHKAIKTTTTDTPGISAVTKIVSVSALPVIQELNTLYILV